MVVGGGGVIIKHAGVGLHSTSIHATQPARNFSNNLFPIMFGEREKAHVLVLLQALNNT